ncbi:MAG: hypothetical protein L3J61_05030, partial [Ghiorsea sp.]|nr:hypothetical protein [Ghiorsea sp.]
ILVANMQGGTSDISGTWGTACLVAFSANGLDRKYKEVYSGSSYTLIETEYATSDGTCGGAATEVGRVTASFTIGSNVTATQGWIDATGAAIATPIAQSGTTSLPNAPVATELLASNVVGTGTIAGANPTRTIRRAVDASVANNMATYDVYNPTGAGLTADTEFKATKQ